MTGAGAHPPAAGFRVPAESAAVARIAAVTGELAAAESLDAIVTVVAERVSRAVHASVSTLILRDGDQLFMTGQRGVASEKAHRWSVFPVSGQNPASESVRTGHPVVAATPEEVRARYPSMAVDTPSSRSVIDLPLRAGGEVIGAIGLTFEENWDPGPFELDFLMTFADACAQAIRRVRATEEAAGAAAQLSFLARASGELSSSLDYRATLSSVARLSVPTLADWCAVDLLVDGTLATLALAHVDTDKVAWAWQLREDYPPDMAAQAGPANVVRTGIGELFPDITDEMLVAGARDEQHLRLSRELNMRSAMVVPLLARGRALGTITLIRTRGSRRFTDTDLDVAEDLGRRAGVAIDNAQLFDQTANIARELQDALLPDRLGELPGWQTAAHYHPAGNADVGGDFYDAVRLRDGRLGVFIGDVMGHGIKAAAMMSQIRAAIRAFLTIDPEPEVVMTKLDVMFEELSLDTLVSLVYLLVEPSGALRIANAGHPPPLIVTASDDCTLAQTTPRPALGAGPAATPIATLALNPGDTLVLFTDGLVERRDENIDASLARLVAHGPLLNQAPLQTAISELIRQVVGSSGGNGSGGDSGSGSGSANGRGGDDVAAIAIRRRIPDDATPGPRS